MYQFYKNFNHPISQERQDWAIKRRQFEEEVFDTVSRHKKGQYKKRIQKIAQYWPFSWLDRWGQKNMLRININEHIFYFDHLPASFDHFSILHISDPHFDASPDLTEAICQTVTKVKADLTVLTGDYQFGYTKHPPETFEGLKKISLACQSELPILAVLGNHDRAEIVQKGEDQRMIFLTNQLVSIEKQNQKLLIYGIDEAVLPQNFKKDPNQFGICLGHNVEFAQPIAKQNWNFMLAGHSHGGQICLPFGIAPHLSVRFNRHIAIGKWHAFNMQGYTSKGCGTSTLPWRFNCDGEITLIHLRCSFKKGENI